MLTLKLYNSPGSCSLASHILLLETGLEFTTTSISVKDGAPASLGLINPKMRVPVLILDNETITETPAIMTAISQLAPSLHLLGQTGLETVRTYEWLNWLSGTLHGQAFGCFLRPARFSDDESTWEGIREKGRKTAEECFEKIEGDLKGVYAVGEGFTVVDSYLYVFWRWGNSALGLDMKGKYPKFAALVGNLAERKSVKDALEVEGVKGFLPIL